MRFSRRGSRDSLVKEEVQPVGRCWTGDVLSEARAGLMSVLGIEGG